MVQHIDRAFHYRDIALRIDVAADIEKHLLDVLDIHVFVNDDDDFAKHELSQSPQAVHDFLRMERIAFVNGNEGEVVKNTEYRQMHVYQFRQLHLDERQEDARRRRAHATIFHRGFANDNRLIDRAFAMRYRRDAAHRVFIGQRVKPRVIPEGPFYTGFIGFNISLNDNVGIGGHEHIDGFRGHHRHVRFAEVAGEQEFVYTRWQRRSANVGHHRVSAYCNGDRHRFTGLLILTMMGGTIVVNLPMHRQRCRAEFLQPIGADIPLSGAQAVRQHLRQRDILIGIKGPAFEER